MLTSYSAFEKALVTMLRVRSKNYVNTDCDIVAIIEVVYSDLSSNIIFNWVKHWHLVDDREIILLPRNNISNDDVLTLTEEYGVVTDIVDENDRCIKNLLFRVNENEYKWTSEEAMKEYIDRSIAFVRPVIYKIDSLPIRFYDKVFTAMLEGIMYHIQLSIPSDGDTQAGNLAYQRYYSEKQKLLNLYPQVQYVDKNIPIMENRYEYY